MIPLDVKVKVYVLNEETLEREVNFDYTGEEQTHVENEIDRTLTGMHVIGEDGRVFVVRVVDIHG